MLLKFEEKKNSKFITQSTLDNLNTQRIEVIQTFVKDIPEIELSHWHTLSSKTYIRNHIQKLELSLS